MSMFCRWFPWLCQSPIVIPTAPPIAIPVAVSDPAPPPIGEVGPSATETGPAAPSFAALLNAERAQFGLAPMAVDDGLTSMAQEWATEQANLDFMSHGDFPARMNRVHPDGWAAENIAEGNADVLSTFEQWMDSPPHRANMLGGFTHCGIGHAVSASGNHYWCADFARLG